MKVLSVIPAQELSQEHCVGPVLDQEPSSCVWTDPLPRLRGGPKAQAVCIPHKSLIPYHDKGFTGQAKGRFYIHLGT